MIDVKEDILHITIPTFIYIKKKNNSNIIVFQKSILFISQSLNNKNFKDIVNSEVFFFLKCYFINIILICLLNIYFLLIF